MHTCKLLLTTLLVFNAPFSYATTINALQLNSREAVDLALRNNNSLQAARATIATANASSKYAGRLENPELRLGYTSDRAFNDEGERAYSIGFEQKFPVTNRLKLLKSISSIEVQLAQAELLNQERLLIRDVESAVELVASLDQRRALLDGMIALQEEFAGFLEKRIENGEASTLDLNQVQVSLFSVKQEIQKLTKERDRALGSLRAMLGMEAGAGLDIIPDQIQLTSRPIMEALDGEALQLHPEYQLRLLMAEVASEHTAIARAGRWADIAVELFFEEERAVDEPFGLETDRFFGIGVSIPLPIHDRKRGEIAASRFREKQIQHEIAGTALRLQNEAETHRRNAEATYRQAATYKEKAVSLVEKNLEEISNAYAAGQVDLGEVFRVQEQHLHIQNAQLELWHELKQLLIEWRAATARNLPNSTN